MSDQAPETVEEQSPEPGGIPVFEVPMDMDENSEDGPITAAIKAAQADKQSKDQAGEGDGDTGDQAGESEGDPPPDQKKESKKPTETDDDDPKSDPEKDQLKRDYDESVKAMHEAKREKAELEKRLEALEARVKEPEPQRQAQQQPENQPDPNEIIAHYGQRLNKSLEDESGADTIKLIAEIADQISGPMLHELRQEINDLKSRNQQLEQGVNYTRAQIPAEQQFAYIVDSVKGQAPEGTQWSDDYSGMMAEAIRLESIFYPGSQQMTEAQRLNLLLEANKAVLNRQGSPTPQHQPERKRPAPASGGMTRNPSMPPAKPQLNGEVEMQLTTGNAPLYDEVRV